MGIRPYLRTGWWDHVHVDPLEDTAVARSLALEVRLLIAMGLAQWREEVDLWESNEMNRDIGFITSFLACLSLWEEFKNNNNYYYYYCIKMFFFVFE
jgi:hypothetical protein